MNLREYLASEGALTRTELRELIGAKSDAQIRQWECGYANRKPGPAFCMSIETATGGKVSRRDLRPDDCEKIWPELKDAQPAKPVARVKARAA